MNSTNENDNNVIAENADKKPGLKLPEADETDRISVIVEQDASGKKKINIKMDNDDDERNNKQDDRGTMECGTNCKINCPNFCPAADTFRDKMATCGIILSGILVTVLVFIGLASCVRIYRDVTSNRHKSGDYESDTDNDIPIYGTEGTFRSLNTKLMAFGRSLTAKSEKSDSDAEPIVEFPGTPPPSDDESSTNSSSLGISYLFEGTDGFCTELCTQDNQNETKIDIHNYSQFSDGLQVSDGETSIDISEGVYLE
ncbi:hypothetical protein THOM_3148 [Trachipleistophora hominis]|uniref:Uncharacterized protein n=1 Tax=Trachipleistophora hominis TaxID=72359 RepID=L7JT67_TRAHO|nr:hypothetical protein THOM_3148 [Trachipleistophora hominis]